MLKYQTIIDRLTLEEKAGLCSGEDFWHLKSVERLGLRPIMVCDGPHGLRKQRETVDKVGLGNSVPATCFPTAVTTACSWDPELLTEMGKAIAKECLAEKVSVLLGPGTNMKRSPTCGRNFEYFSEDPYLAGQLATGFINGVQSQGVGTSLKHFAGNSQETRRMTVDAVVDERALREIYLPAFEAAVKDAKPWTVMNAYNRLNGTFCSENKWLQDKVLRDEWGFDGLVVSDWGAVNNRVEGVRNGNDLEMPSSGGYNDANIVKAVLDGTLDVESLDRRVDRIIDLIMKASETLDNNQGATVDFEENNRIARKVASESVVLLKNDGALLPLSSKKIAVIGDMAKHPRYQGAGSSLINPTDMTCCYDELIKAGFEIDYAKGYSSDKKAVERVLLDEAACVARDAEVALVFIGLTPEYESEGYDRSHMLLPDTHNRLIDAVAAVNKNVVVVLSGGSPVEMPWLGKVKTVLNGYLGGQAGGGALADVISGKVCPSGKLAETYPIHYEDTPAFKYYPGKILSVENRESIYIGYRYYDTAKKAVCFPFGFGLSYTEFEYSDIKLSKKKMNDDEEVAVSFKVKNIGKVDGAETAQLYVRDDKSTIFRPDKELKGFKKVFLKAGEESEITLTLGKRAFAYYNVELGDWHVESGDFTILVGASSADTPLTAKIKVTSTVEATVPDYSQTAPHYYGADITDISDDEFTALLGRELPQSELPKDFKVDITSSLEQAENSKWGRRIINSVNSIIGVALKDDPNLPMMQAMLKQIPIRDFVSMSLGLFSEEMADGLIKVLNGEEPSKGFLKILQGIPHLIANLGNLLKAI